MPALPLQASEEHYDGLVTRSVRFPSDTAPFKPAADILLVGCAYPPPGATKTTVRLSLSRGPRVILNKTLEVSADGSERMPIMYERSYGGAGYAANPLGVGADSDAVPSIRYPGSAGRVAGFGAISELWPERRARLGEHRATVRAHEPTIPADFDWRFFQSAPADQQTVYLVGDEQIMLDGLRPGRAHSEHTLPKARAVAAVFGLTAERALVAMEADTLLLEPDEERASLTWRGVMEVPDECLLDDVLIAAGVAVDGAPIVLPTDRDEVEQGAIAADIAVPPSSGGDFEGTMALVGDAGGDVAAPFAIAEAGQRPRGRSSETPWSEAGPSAVPVPTADLAGTLVMSDGAEKELIERVMKHEAAVEAAKAPAPPATTEDGVPLRWKREAEAAEAATEAAAEPRAAPVPQIQRRKAIAPSLYDGLAGKGKRK